MAFISVSNTFSDGTVSSAPQVNTNFNDIVNGLASTTYDLSMANVYGTTVSAVSGLFARVSCVSGYFGQVSAPSANLTTINNTVISSATGLFGRVSCVSGYFSQVSTPSFDATTISAVTGLFGRVSCTSGYFTQVSAATGLFDRVVINSGSNLDIYRGGSFTGTVTGFAISFTTSLIYTQIGKQVTISFKGNVLATSTANTMSITGIYSPLVAGITYRGVFPVLLTDNGADSWGYGYLEGATINFTRTSLITTSFTASGSKGFYWFTIAYALE